MCPFRSSSVFDDLRPRSPLTRREVRLEQNIASTTTQVSPTRKKDSKRKTSIPPTTKEDRESSRSPQTADVSSYLPDAKKKKKDDSAPCTDDTIGASEPEPKESVFYNRHEPKPESSPSSSRHFTPPGEQEVKATKPVANTYVQNLEAENKRLTKLVQEA